MTCFWNGILHSLNDDDWRILKFSKKPSINEFILKIKVLNRPLNAVKWQNQVLTKQEKQEHFEAIRDYDITKINQGHLTSICDPFLLFLSDFLNIKIIHIFLNSQITYETTHHIRKTLKFRSNHSHFQRFSA
tara:strand:- start:95 stop:490 length:396 start_codon:yes stop_codon:yes gene_type:complete